MGYVPGTAQPTTSSSRSSCSTAPQLDAGSSPSQVAHPVTREHLTVLLRGWVQEGQLVRVGRGRYALGSEAASA
jgi:hypothetical protein